jgi:predicted amidophosphoribosyltransferase
LCHRSGAAPCVDCIETLDRAPSLPAPPGVDSCRALLSYGGEGRELVARLKYRNARASLQWLAREMAALVDPRDVDVVTWIPTTAARRRHRGFDQAELLSRAVARQLRRPCRALFDRRAGPPQTGRSGIERRVGPSLAVRSTRTAPVPTSVLVVDDVVTTGATITAAARALKAEGVGRVTVLAAARTPLKRARARPDTQVQ